ncbi:efflux transporter outer membrane subunit [Aquabacterium sp. CECT 9606]|uniref:efflux transporter outer membrane subunit n=1 Tax=Aquabacterium sp. CECT 9606 TaxID=2845822 RepID=UPI001E616B28|nr:TolC family protein [Aquabacterium sp. CECT 9606]CAH0350934.1 hypothetical protein AQB9606_01841 [Aquabacterium sp. CECT 9606]
MAHIAWHRLGMLLSIPAAAALCACSNTVEVTVPTARVRVPGHFMKRPGVDKMPAAPRPEEPPSPPQAAGTDLQRWWLDLNDPVLNALIERGLQENTDIRIALDRVREARAYQTQAESAHYPTVEAFGGLAYSKATVRLPDWPQPLNWPSVSLPTAKQSAAGLAVAWEVDLFGSRHSFADSVHHLVHGAQEQVHGAQLLVAGEIATQYLEARGVEQRIEVLKRGIVVARRLVSYATGRFNAGQTKRTDVLRAEAEAEYTESQMAGLRLLLQQRLLRLATLTGQAAEDLQALPPQPAGGGIPASLPTMLPSEVLENRPDVRGAAHVVRARAAELGSAKADLLPKFYLGFLAGEGHISLSNLPTTRASLQAWGLGVQLPLFTAGRLHAKIAVQDARLDSAVADYERAIRQALEDVENAYQARLALDARNTQLERAVNLQQEASRDGEKLYRAGQELLQPVLESQAKALQREDELVQSRTVSTTTTVLLYKALGAGWSEASARASMAALEASAEGPAAQPPQAAPTELSPAVQSWLRGQRRRP